jgi:hypothetical protein
VTKIVGELGFMGAGGFLNKTRGLGFFTKKNGVFGGKWEILRIKAFDGWLISGEN